MKKIISMILVFAMLLTTVNISFAAEVEQGDITSYGASAVNDITKLDVISESNESMMTLEYAEEGEEESCIPSKDNLLPVSLSEPTKETDEAVIDIISDVSAVNSNATYSTTDFTFNANLLTSFNTITGPIAGNGANEPKFSYNSFLEENISDYSGELTLNFEDLVLDGRNGLDLRIGRTYQTVASNIGEKSIMILPNENGYLRNNLVNNYSTYLLDRYNLGMGWGFSFPSVQIETEYIPQEVVDTYSSRAGFPVEWIQNTNNVVSISKEIHQKISAYYSSIDPFISGNQTIRNWLNTQSFQSQYEFGIKVLEKFGVYVGK